MIVSWAQPEECESVVTATVMVSLPDGVGTVASNWPSGAAVATTVALSVLDPGWSDETVTCAPGVVVPVTAVEAVVAAPLDGAVIVTGTLAGGPAVT